MGNISLLLAKNFCSLVVPPSSTFSSSFSSSSFRTVVNKKIVFQKRQRSILQPCRGTLSAHYTWNLDSSTAMDQHLSCYFTDQFISSIPSNSLPNRSLETYFMHDHFNPCFLQNGDKRSSPDAMFKAERYTKGITRLLLKLLLHPETRLCCWIYVFFRRLEVTGRLSDDCNGSSNPN